MENEHPGPPLATTGPRSYSFKHFSVVTPLAVAFALSSAPASFCLIPAASIAFFAFCTSDDIAARTGSEGGGERDGTPFAPPRARRDAESN